MNTREGPDKEIHFCIDSVLDGNFRPVSPKHREMEIESLLLAAKTSRNLLITGQPGTGKTMVIRMVFDRIRQEETGVFPVYVNARMHSSRYMIFSEIYVQLSGSGEYPVNQSFQKLEKAVWRVVKRHGCRLLVCLDDADYIFRRNSLNDLLHSLLKFGEIHEGTDIAVWAIVSENNVDTTLYTDKSIKPLFSPARVSFRPYEREEMHDILIERIGSAIGKGILSGKAFELILDHACITGDPRAGIGLYHRSAFSAAIQGNAAVTAEIIGKNMPDAAMACEGIVIDSLPRREMEIYGIIRKLAAGGTEMAMTPVFRQVHEQTGICYSLFFRAVNRLEEAGLIRTRYSRNRGRKRLIEMTKR